MSKTIWQKHFENIALAIEEYSEGDISMEAALVRIHDELDEARAFGYRHVSDSAFEKISIVCEELGLP